MNKFKVYGPSANFPSFSSLEINLDENEKDFKKFKSIYEEFLDFNNKTKYEKCETALKNFYEILKRNIHSYLNNNLPSLEKTILPYDLLERIEKSFFYGGILKILSNEKEDKSCKMLFLMYLANKEYKKISLDEEEFVISSLRSYEIEIILLALNTISSWKKIKNNNKNLLYEIKINNSYLKNRTKYFLS